MQTRAGPSGLVNSHRVAPGTGGFANSGHRPAVGSQRGADPVGARTGETYPTGSGLSLTYAYDVIDQLTSITDGTSTLASYTHIGLRDKGTTYGNNATRSNAYSGFRNELSGVHHQTSTPATIVRLEYGYNKVHDRTFERFGTSGSSGDAFVYDKIRRLTTAYLGSTNPANPVGNTYVDKIDYNLDDDGNRSSVVTTPFGMTAATVSYTTNSLYEYTSVGGTTHTWDANGNLTANGTYKFEYNYKNLIVKVRNQSDNSLVATYKYDAEGRRVEKDVGGSVERYIRSKAREESGSHELGNNPGGGGRYDMSQVVAVYTGADDWKQNYVWNDEIDGIQVLEQADVLDYDTDGNTVEVTRSYYHRNALGSVMEITDANEATVLSYRYNPYGKPTITRGGVTQSSDPLGQHWAFTGRFFDEESGLYYYRARYYDSDVGRFLQRDPLGYSEGPSLFVYMRSNPTNSGDPSGLQGEGPWEQPPERPSAHGGEVVPAPEPEPAPEATPEEVERMRREQEEEDRRDKELVDKLNEETEKARRRRERERERDVTPTDAAIFGIKFLRALGRLFGG